MPAAKELHIDISARQPLLTEQQGQHQTDDEQHGHQLPVKKAHTHPKQQKDFALSGSHAQDGDGGSVYFIGTATTIIEWSGLRILTDPNFLHAGDHVHLGPGVSAERRTNPAVELDALPPVDLVLLSHYHEDHFDREVESRLSRTFPIVTTPHARKCLTENKGEEDAFRAVHALNFWEGVTVYVDGGESKGTADGKSGGGKAVVKITGMPGKHVPPGPLSIANDLLSAVPPTNGWLLELGHETSSSSSEPGEQSGQTKTGYRIYISGDTLLVDELREIPKWLKDERIDLMLVHLGGTTIPGPSLPLLMVTMDAAQGLELMRLLNPDLTIPIHYDDYSVFLSPLGDFKDKVEAEGWGERVVYLDRGEMYRFFMRDEHSQ